MHDVGYPELLLLVLQFILLVNELLSKNLLFIVEIDKHIQVLFELMLLLFFNNPVNFPLFFGLLPVLLLQGGIVFCFDLLNVSLFSLELLGFPLSDEPFLFFDQSLVVLVELPRLPESHL
jgi:hypothetical protein